MAFNENTRVKIPAILHLCRLGISLFNMKENQQLSVLRDWLLLMLMNGQVAVGESAGTNASCEIKEEMRMVAEPGNEKYIV